MVYEGIYVWFLLKKRGVLILVFVEDGLREGFPSTVKVEEVEVLILVFVEDGLRGENFPLEN